LLNSVVSIFNAGVAAAAGDYESIATVTVGSGGSADIEFTSIPSDYAHLQLRGIFKNTTNSNSFAGMYVRFNGDTASNYSGHYLQGDGSTTYAGGGSNQSGYLYSYTAQGGSSITSMFSVNVFDILDYKDTNKYKTMRHLGGWDFNGSGVLTYGSAAWRNTNAITSIKITLDAGNNFGQYTTVALYGIKGA
jgi:hypothetical protein